MKHIHKYVQIKIGRFRRIEYKCDIPGCPHHINVELVVGRESLCNKCEQPFFMTKEHRMKVKPKCDRCMGRKVDERDKIAELLEKI